MRRSEGWYKYLEIQRESDKPREARLDEEDKRLMQVLGGSEGVTSS